MEWNEGFDGLNATVNDTSYFIKVVTAQNQISRAVYVFCLFQLAGLMAGVFVLVLFVRDRLRAGGAEPGEKFLAWQTVADLLLVLLSLSGLVRPQALETGPAGCAALSFFVNVLYLHGQFSPVLVAAALAGLAGGAFRSLAVCVSAGLSMALLGSAVLAVLLGTPEPQYAIGHYNCHVDPLEAALGYKVTKFCLGLVMPLPAALGFLTYSLVRSRGRRDREWPAAALIVAMALPFLCRLVYNVFLLCRPLYQAGDPHFQHRAELLVTVGELVMFGGSCLALISTAALRWLYQEQTLATLRHAFEPSQATNTW